MQQKWNQNFDGELMPDIPQKFLNAGCDVYMVMQLRHDEKILDERFASMRELNRRGKTPDPEHYEVTYYADLPAMWQDVPNNEVLEELFQMFNLSRPQDFEGHSLSVSDVIALKRNGEVSVHYVDSIGFKDLQGFLDKQPERPSVLQTLKEKCDAPECNPTFCRKVRDAHELYPRRTHADDALQLRHPAGAGTRVAADAVLSDARRNCPAGVVGGRYREAETADRCGVCRTGISPGLTFAACGRRT